LLITLEKEKDKESEDIKNVLKKEFMIRETALLQEKQAEEFMKLQNLRLTMEEEKSQIINSKDSEYSKLKEEIELVHSEKKNSLR